MIESKSLGLESRSGVQTNIQYLGYLLSLRWRMFWSRSWRRRMTKHRKAQSPENE